MNYALNLGISIGESSVLVGTLTDESEYRILQKFSDEITFTEKQIQICCNTPSKNRLRLIPLIKSTSKCCNAIHLKKMIFPLSDEEALAIYFQKVFSALEESGLPLVGSVVIALPFTPSSAEKEKIQLSLSIAGVLKSQVFSSMLTTGVSYARTYYGQIQKQSQAILTIQIQQQSFSMSIVQIEEAAIFISKSSKETFPEDHALLFCQEDERENSFSQILKAYRSAAESLQIGVKINHVMVVTSIRNTPTLRKLLNSIFGTVKIFYSNEGPLAGACILASNLSILPAHVSVHELTVQRLKLQCDSQFWTIPIDHNKSSGLVFEENIPVSPQGSNIILQEYMEAAEESALVGQWKAIATGPLPADSEASAAVLTCTLQDTGNFAVEISFPDGTCGHIFRMDSWLVGLPCDTVALKNLLQYYDVEDKADLDMKVDNPKLTKLSDRMLRKGVRECVRKFGATMEHACKSGATLEQIERFHEELSNIIVQRFLLSNRQNMIAGRGAVNNFLKLLVQKLNRRFENICNKNGMRTRASLEKSTQLKVTPPPTALLDSVQLTESIKNPAELYTPSVLEIDPTLRKIIQESLEKHTEVAVKTHRKILYTMTDKKEPFTDRQIKQFHEASLHEVLAVFTDSVGQVLSEFSQLEEVREAKEKMQKDIDSQLLTYLKRHEVLMEGVSKNIKRWMLEAEAFYDEEMEGYQPKKHSRPEVQAKHNDLEKKILETFRLHFKDNGYEEFPGWDIELLVRLGEWEGEALLVAFPELNKDALNQSYRPLNSPGLIKFFTNQTPNITSEDGTAKTVGDFIEELHAPETEEDESSSRGQFTPISMPKEFETNMNESAANGLTEEILANENITEEALQKSSNYKICPEEVTLETKKAEDPRSKEAPNHSSQINELRKAEIVTEGFEEHLEESVKTTEEKVLKLAVIVEPLANLKTNQQNIPSLGATQNDFPESNGVSLTTRCEHVENVQETTTEKANCRLPTPEDRPEAADFAKTLQAFRTTAQKSYKDKMIKFGLEGKTKPEVLAKHNFIKDQVLLEFRQLVEEHEIEWQDSFRQELEEMLEKELQAFLDNADDEVISETIDVEQSSDSDKDSEESQGETAGESSLESNVPEFDHERHKEEHSENEDSSDWNENQDEMTQSTQDYITDLENGEEVLIMEDEENENEESNQDDLYDYIRTFMNPDLNVVITEAQSFLDFNEAELMELARATPIYNRHYLGTIFEDPIEEEIAELENELTCPIPNEPTYSMHRESSYSTEFDSSSDSSTSANDSAGEDYPITEIEEHEEIEEITTEVITRTTKTYTGLCSIPNCVQKQQTKSDFMDATVNPEGTGGKYDTVSEERQHNSCVSLPFSCADENVTFTLPNSMNGNIHCGNGLPSARKENCNEKSTFSSSDVEDRVSNPGDLNGFKKIAQDFQQQISVVQLPNGKKADTQENKQQPENTISAARPNHQNLEDEELPESCTEKHQDEFAHLQAFRSEVEGCLQAEREIGPGVALLSGCPIFNEESTSTKAHFGRSFGGEGETLTAEGSPKATNSDNQNPQHEVTSSEENEFFSLASFNKIARNSLFSKRLKGFNRKSVEVIFDTSLHMTL